MKVTRNITVKNINRDKTKSYRHLQVQWAKPY